MTPQVSPPVEEIPNPQDDPPQICPILTLAGETFERDLPELLSKYRGQWTAYHGARRLGIVKTYREAIRLYQKFGIHPYEVAVWIVEEIPDETFIGMESH